MVAHHNHVGTFIGYLTRVGPRGRLAQARPTLSPGGDETKSARNFVHQGHVDFLERALRCLSGFGDPRREGDVEVYSNNGVYKRSLGTGKIYVADSNNRRIQVFDKTGRLQWTAPCGAPPPPPPSMALLAGCTGVDTDGQGNVYAAAPTEHTVYKYSPTGALLQKIGSLGSGNGQLRAPYDVAIWKGKLYVTESNNRRVSVFNFRGGYQGRFGSRGEGDGQFEQPRGIDIDNNGKAYVVDGLLERVSVFQLR